MVTDHPFYTGLGNEAANDAARIEQFRNSAVFFPGPKNRVRLSDGRGRYPLTPASGESKIVVHHVLPLRWGDGRRELAVVFSDWSGGSGTFFSLAIFADGVEVFTTRIFLGDRIGVDSLRRAALDRRQPADYRLAVTLRDRRSNQAFADKPTVLAHALFRGRRRTIGRGAGAAVLIWRSPALLATHKKSPSAAKLRIQSARSERRWRR